MTGLRKNINTLELLFIYFTTFLKAQPNTLLSGTGTGYDDVVFFAAAQLKPACAVEVGAVEHPIHVDHLHR